MACIEEVEIDIGYAKEAMDKFIQSLGIQNPKPKATKASKTAENYMGILYRITLEEEGLSYILKIPSPSSELRENYPLTRIYKREVYAYNVMLKEIQALETHYKVPLNDCLSVPKCFEADSEITKEFLILEDMNCSGYSMFDRRQTLDMDHIKLCLKNLAHFHAASFKMKKCQPEMFREWFEMCDSWKYYDNFFERAAEAHKKKAYSVIKNLEHKERVMAFGGDFIKKVDELTLKDFDKPYSVICHGDCWTNNILFKYEDKKVVDACFIDWQLIKYASPIIDVSFLIFLSGEHTLRKHRFSEMLDFYYSCLESRLAMFEENVEELFPRRVFDDHCKKFMQFGFMMGVALMPLILAEAGDLGEVEDLIGKNKVEILLQNMSLYEKRINDLVEDCVMLDII